MNAVNEDALELLRRTLRAVEPWPGKFIVVGGWAMQLYRYLRDADASVAVHHTNDVDVAVAQRSRFPDELCKRLEGAGLVAVRSRATTPGATYFQIQRHGNRDLAPEYVEFLVPQVGADKLEAVEIASGLGALTLRYLDLSFAQVQTVDASRVPFLSGLGSSKVYVPSPASYLLGKALVYEKRKHDEKRDGDCAYIYWLACVTLNIWPAIKQDLRTLDVHDSWRERGYARLRALFKERTSDGVVRAVRSIDDIDHGAAVVHGIVQRFLRAVGVLS